MTRKFEQTSGRRRRQQDKTSVRMVSPPNSQRVTPNSVSTKSSQLKRSTTQPAVKLATARTSSKSAQLSTHRQAPRKRLQAGSFVLVLLLRLLILSIGAGAIAGIVFTIRGLTGEQQTARPSDDESRLTSPSPTPVNPFDATLKGDLEMALLRQQIQVLAAAQPGLTPGMFFLNLNTGAFLDLNGTSSFSAASMIKVPILVAFFQDVDAGRVRLDEQLIMRPDLIAGGSGAMQYKKPGSQFSALETATQMIVISDNTATNLLIDRLGGAAALNQRFQAWGLTQTMIHNLLADLEGTNTTSPQDLTKLMTLVSEGNLLSRQSRDRLLNIMRQTVTDTLLPRGLGKGATIAHKTGDIGSTVGDTGLIDMPNGQRYVATVIVKRPHNDPRAQELIRQISRLVYNYQSQPPLNPPGALTAPGINQAGTNPPPPLD